MHETPEVDAEGGVSIDGACIGCNGDLVFSAVFPDSVK